MPGADSGDPDTTGPAVNYRKWHMLSLAQGSHYCLIPLWHSNLNGLLHHLNNRGGNNNYE